jgi:uncharacterized membrane protein
MKKACIAPPESKSAVTENQLRRAELIISTVLRTGVITSILVIVLGVLLSTVHHPGSLDSPAILKQVKHPGAFPHTIAEIAAGVRSLKGSAVIALGLLLLIATPVLRVGTSILIFIAQKDRVFTTITATVFVLLILSFVLGRR